MYITVQADARAAFGLDLRLKVKDAGNFIDSKLNKCVSNIYRIWEASESVKAVQAVFINARAPEENGFFNPHVYMRDALRDLGIPLWEIAFIHDYDTAEKRKELFCKINEGEIRVVFGSAEKLGTGTNIQKRMIAIHQVDCPWIPALIEQQIGRIIRQGNIFDPAIIFNYLTQGEGDKPGFDSYIWGVILKKLQFITQLMSGDETARQADDIGEMQVSASQMMALASGNPAYERWFNIEQEIKALEIEKKQKDSQYIENQVLRTKATLEIDKITDGILPGAKQDLAKAQGRKKSLIVKRKEFDLSDEGSIKDAVEAIRGEFLRTEALSSGNDSGSYLAASHCGELDGFKIRISPHITQFRLLLVGENYSYLLPTKSKEQIKETLLAPIASFIEVEIKSQESKLKELKETVKSLGLQSCIFTKEEELKSLLEEQRLLKIELFPEELTDSDSESPKEKESETLVLGEAQPSFEFKPSPCPYNGVETEIVETLKQRLIDETPEWMEYIYSACKNVAEKETAFIEELNIDWDTEWNPDDYNDETPDIDFECWEDEDDDEDENFIGIENPDDELYDQLFD